ncbi:MAG: hypothetical protein V5A58_11640 [Salinibacter sp.]
MNQAAIEEARRRAQDYLNRAGIVLTDEEAANIEVADFGLGELMETGLQLVTYVNTQRVCAKELVLFPRQTCPEHKYPPIGGDPGKEETLPLRGGGARRPREGGGDAAFIPNRYLHGLERGRADPGRATHHQA